MPEAAYDSIGRSYSLQRRPDPRIAAHVLRALGDARRVCNVGAGTGSYEPDDRAVVAVEPSDVMLAQRAPGTAPAVRGVAEALPFPDDAFDATLGVLTVHHWADLDAGLAELRRVAPKGVIFGFDEPRSAEFWLVADYFPEAAAVESARAPQIDDIVEGIGATRVEVVPIPHDCVDGFAGAYWRRPEAYLDPQVRAGISSFSILPTDVVDRAVKELQADLESGRWHDRHADLLELDEIDLGYRLVIAD